MRLQPNRNYKSNDNIETPLALAEEMVAYFKPTGRVLEPCAAGGNILRFLPPESSWCEIQQGRDFFEHTESVNWIITNPPWSQIRTFLQHSFLIADEVVFLMTVNHAWTKARLRDMSEAGFGLKTIWLVATPPEFPNTGFQLGAVHYSRHWTGGITLARSKTLRPSQAGSQENMIFAETTR